MEPTISSDTMRLGRQRPMSTWQRWWRLIIHWLTPKKLLIIGLVLVGVVVIQIFWPSSRARPFRKVSGTSVGFASQKEVENTLHSVATSATLSLSFKDGIQVVPTEQLGIDFNSTASAQNSLRYPLWQRFIPFSLVTFFNNTRAETAVDRTQLESKVKELTDKHYHPAHNAAVDVHDTTATLAKATSGERYEQAVVSDILVKMAPSRKNQRVKLKSIEVKPVRKDSSVEDLVKETQRVINTPLTVAFANKQERPGAAVIAGWLQFNESSDKKTVSLSLNPDKVAAYIAPFAKSIYIPPGITKVSVVDGNEVSRVAGSAGRGLDTVKSTAAIKEALLEKKVSTATLSVSELAPTVQSSRSYTSSQAGLQALLNDLVKDNGDFAISVLDMSGTGWTASTNGSKAYHPASTYKLFVAYSLLKRIDSGDIKLSDPSTGGNTIDQCLTLMIVRSDNTCAEWLGGTKLKWSTVTSEARGLGLSSATNLNGNFSSTPHDEALFLNRLQNDDILKPESRDKLLGLMKQQIYRAGIPTGVKPASVADKVGFLDGLLHDAGIVYGKRTYALVIFSNNSSWGTIAKISQAIHAFMSR